MTYKNLEQWLLKHFRRITSSDSFFPEIDGLRFLAIATVVLYHVNGYLFIRDPSVAALSDKEWFYTQVLSPICRAGHQGVQLFFVISGFILSYPFARAYLSGGECPSYLKYLKRRLTRLEPPYIIVTTLFFVGSLLSYKKHSVAELWPSFLASLTYTHNLFFRGELPRVNSVLWSLEIEIQFYLLAPAICWLYFKAKRSSVRKMIGLLVVALWAFFADRFQGLSLLKFGYYFIAGIIICDVVCSGDNQGSLFRSKSSAILGAWLLCILLTVDFVHSGNKVLLMMYPFVIMLFYLSVLLNPLLKKVFSNVFLVVTGGMCYSVYMLHYGVIKLVGPQLLHLGRGWGFYPFFALQMAIDIACIAIISAVFFKLIERPCMRKQWPQELWAKLRPGRSQT